MHYFNPEFITQLKTTGFLFSYHKIVFSYLILRWQNMLMWSIVTLITPLHNADDIKVLLLLLLVVVVVVVVLVVVVVVSLLLLVVVVVVVVVVL